MSKQKCPKNDNPPLSTDFGTIYIYIHRSVEGNKYLNLVHTTVRVTIYTLNTLWNILYTIIYEM